ncbi:Histidinol dehydrogenase [Hondaea fermentalgiana]|uniref:Histidinol dehydrogenase n=1 Tax=Hondaea fermentalgiana TaxID=2315210 RepID=A0A2R5G2N0_9STRA|nr:Histidinol dehydrogenase [Hondaea fermentalgiana]|eukprot:GBG24795.1 Histidinol dehydrogenase [Hondaea fermentalgiana]
MAQLREVAAKDVKGLKLDPVDEKTLAGAQAILSDVEKDGEKGFLKHAERLGDLKAGQNFMIGKDELKAAFDALPEKDRGVLERTADRVRKFAEAQRGSIKDIEVPVPGGSAGHQLAPVRVAGCYAPGGRYPLPSSVIMTAVTARVAGVESVWVASPNPQPATLAAAFIAGADGLLAAGGAHAIGAFAYGLEDKIPACDVIVGPGNRWVTAAKKLVSGLVSIDMLAGPSECLVMADSTADPAVIAADLLAQAEHDTDALPVLVTWDKELPAKVNAELKSQLETLTTAEVASVAVSKGFYVIAADKEEAITVTSTVGPEHLEVMTTDAKADTARISSYGGAFIGQKSAEVIGDYGAGPNHVLPTSGSARYTGGLSIFTFLRIRTFLHMDDEDSTEQTELFNDAVHLARMEGLEGHARAAEARLKGINKRANGAAEENGDAPEPKKAKTDDAE